ncbi:MAG: type V CRISPR-associated endonuclease Cas1 [Sulfurimonas sp.]
MMSLPDFKQKQIIFALLNMGEKLSFKNDNIVITDSEGKIKHQSTCYKLFALFIVGHTSITSGLLQRSKKFGFSITMFSYGLVPYGTWQYKTEGNFLLRQKQYAYDKTDIAKHLVANKISRSLYYLEKRRDKSDELKKAIKHLYHYKSLPKEDLDFKEILGVEGVSSRLYFTHMFDNISWNGRSPRTKKDITNLLLDIGYMQLFHIIDAMLNLYGFDTYKGVYHKEFYRRKSLVADIIEPFRSIVDYAIRKAYNLGQIKENDFDFINGQYRIFGDKAKPYIFLLLTAILEYKDEIFIYIQQYYRAFMRDKPSREYPIFIGRQI